MKRTQREVRKEVRIKSRDYWRKALENQQSNWALIESDPADGSALVYFFHELSGVFDRLKFQGRLEAESALRRNNFYRLADEMDEAQFPGPPPPFFEDEHPTGAIYSSGRFWRGRLKSDALSSELALSRRLARWKG